MPEELARISLTIPANLLKELDDKSPNRSSYITQLLKDEFYPKATQIICLEISSRELIKYYFDANNKFLIDLDKVAPVLAASIDNKGSDGPKINIVSLKFNIPVLLRFYLGAVKSDEGFIRDSSDWLKLIEAYDEKGEFVNSLQARGALIVDEIKL